MKKTAKLASITAGIILVAGLSTGTAFAMNTNSANSTARGTQTTSHQFVDADGDGVCDNIGTGMGGQNGTRNFVDGDGDGVCDNVGTGKGMGTGTGFVDEDGDGVCDNVGTGMGLHKGAGMGQGRG